MINALLVACGGGFTTFSSFAAESTDLMKSGILFWHCAIFVPVLSLVSSQYLRVKKYHCK